jgi:hypothetical protein
LSVVCDPEPAFTTSSLPLIVVLSPSLEKFTVSPLAVRLLPLPSKSTSLPLPVTVPFSPAAKLTTLPPSAVRFAVPLASKVTVLSLPPL